MNCTTITASGSRLKGLRRHLRLIRGGRCSPVDKRLPGLIEKLRNDLRSRFLKKSPFRALFRAFYLHPAHKSALRAEGATRFRARGKPGWPPMSPCPLFSRPTPHAPRPTTPAPVGVRSCLDPPPHGYCLTLTA